MRKDMMKVSIIIPIYNVEICIRRCLDSILNQVYTNIEVICIDDCSTDGSVRIIEEYRALTNQIKFIRLTKNSGAYIARKRGMEIASGDYVLFVDADDYIDLGLVSELVELSRRHNTDIIHFSSLAEDYGVGEARIKDMQRFLEPMQGEIYGEDVFTKCFCELEYSFNLWGKLFKASLCNRVFSFMEDYYVPKANDLLMYFFMSAEAESYVGCATKQKYHYCYGRGDTGKWELTGKEFGKYSYYVQVLEFIRRLSVSVKLPQKQETLDIAIGKLEERFLKEATEVWIFNVREDEKSIALGAFLEAWGEVNITDMLCKEFPGYKKDFARHLVDSGLIKKKCISSKKIAFYYKKYGQGGVERVISLLIPLFLDMEYDVVLITESKQEKNDFPLPELVRRYTIPSKVDIDAGKVSYRSRANMLIDICQKEQIDTICYQESSSRYLLFDLVVMKSIGVKFILSKHELFSQHYVYNQDLLTEEIYSYQLLDALTVLSSEEETFWRTLGVNSVLIPNPLTIKKKTDFQYDSESHDIVWVGRLDRNQKRYQDIVPIMEEVVRDVPDATLRIYGSPETYKDLPMLKAQILDAHLEENVKYMGYSNQIEDIFSNAGILLMTSAYESSPMVVLESKQFGVPIVMYSMPYIETLKNGKGYIDVRQGDTASAARAIVRLLKDSEYRLQLSHDAAESLADYSDDNVILRWKHLLADGTNNEIPSDNVYSDIIRTMVFHMSLGCDRYKKLCKKYTNMSVDRKLLDIKNISDARKLKVAIYPFGILGKKLLERLNSIRVEVSLIVDNTLANSESSVLAVRDLKNIEVKDYLFVISGINMKVYEEIRTEIRKYVPEENIYDFYPANEE